MSTPYRADLEALHVQCSILRRRLSEVEEASAAERKLRLDLEARQAELQKARITRAEERAAARRVGTRRLALGVFLGALACAFLLLFAQRLSAAGAAIEGLTPAGWFEKMRPHCNPLESAVMLRRTPPPAGAEGQVYLAGCYALAGSVDEARMVIDALPVAARKPAVELVLRLAHPIADAGEEQVAAPLMELVLDHAPKNHMALYHAGMAAHERGEDARAARRLSRFLDLYRRSDGWRRRAEQAQIALEVTE